ncbi:hypothetical protein SDC9_161564 [bioreactor metagenome]|uniref:Uncharacterized protein n=1 Tax=bioreactor metagenome TaxID=1076179 RepID=A0A645FIL0_9ZZZZ
MVLQTVPQFLLRDIAGKRNTFLMQGADQLFIKILRHGRELAARHHYKILRRDVLEAFQETGDLLIGCAGTVVADFGILV